MINASVYYSKGGISLIIIEAESMDALCCLKEVYEIYGHKQFFVLKLTAKLLRYLNTFIIYQKLKIKLKLTLNKIAN